MRRLYLTRPVAKSCGEAMEELPNEEPHREDWLSAEDVAPEPATDSPPALGHVAVQEGRVGGGSAQEVDQPDGAAEQRVEDVLVG